MKRVLLLVLFFVVTGWMYGQSRLPWYYAQRDFLMTSSGAMGVGLYGVDNPALLNYVHQPDALFVWSDQSGKWNEFNRWGMFTALPNIGFNILREKAPNGGGTMTEYNLALGIGSRSFGLGLGYHWMKESGLMPSYSDFMTLGALVRPFRYVSFGVVGNLAMEGSSRQGVVDIGVRPFGNEWLTLFGDVVLQNRKPVGANKHGWSAGAVTELIPGVRFTARYFDTKMLTGGFQISFGRAGSATQIVTDRHQKYSHTIYAIRLGAYDRNPIRSYRLSKKQYVRYQMNTAIKHRRFVLMDPSITLMDLLEQIEAAKKDPLVAGIAINLSGIQINKEMAWEIREKLLDFRSAGKHVVMYFDLAGMTEYHLASVADKIVMDPMGMMMLQGYVSGRTFVKGTLEKLGVGYDEWRFFKYKSAAEMASRDCMSIADREQRQEILNDQYDLVRKDVCQSRSVSAETFDHWINRQTVFLAKDAKEHGLVDTLGRWEEVEKIAKQLEGKKPSFIQPKNITENLLPFDHYWGDKPIIAVVYALGPCAMDEGIKGRTLSKTIEKIAKDRRIKAVVIRVDSPGGDALASDLVAEAMNTCRKHKPVIVSQGSVAASGGYWLSMYGDTIVAAPNTITGSIGVIGGWFYNRGAKEKLGLSTDFVKVGEHADLGFGMITPIIPIQLPDRNLNQEERSKMEIMIKSLYHDFVSKVASGRKKSYEQIEPISQGRIWSGTDAIQNGLVDVIGGLEKAIEIAKIRAGIDVRADVEIKEYPKAELINPEIFMPKLFGIQLKTSPFQQELKLRIENNGRPMPIMPMDEYRENEY